MSKRQKILIVDDEPLNVDYLEQELEDLGYETVSAMDGDEALAQVTAENPDLILLDIIMPGTDGFEVCTILKDDPETRLIPIVIMTALGETRDRVRGIEAGADDFLTKPIDAGALFARIRTSLRLKQTVKQKIDRLLEINQLLASAIEPSEVLRIILESADRLLTTEGGNIAFFDDKEQTLTATTRVKGTSIEKFQLEVGQGFLGWVAQTGKSVISNNVSQDLRFHREIDRISASHTRSVLCVPLRQEDRTIGALEVVNTAKSDGFTLEELQLLTALAGLATVAVDRAKRLALETLLETGQGYQTQGGTVPPIQTERSSTQASTPLHNPALHDEDGLLNQHEISDPLIAFGVYQLDTLNRCLWRRKKRIPLDPKAYAVLHHLIAKAGQLVTKEELLDVVWDEFVGEGVIKFQVQRLRSLLKDDPRTPHFIETIFGHGYRFIGKLKPGNPDAIGQGQTQQKFFSSETKQ